MMTTDKQVEGNQPQNMRIEEILHDEVIEVSDNPIIVKDDSPIMTMMTPPIDPTMMSTMIMMAPSKNQGQSHQESWDNSLHYKETKINKNNNDNSIENDSNSHTNFNYNNTNTNMITTMSIMPSQYAESDESSIPQRIYFVIEGFPKPSARNPVVTAWQIIETLQANRNWCLFYSYCRVDVTGQGYPIAYITGHYPQVSVYERVVKYRRFLSLDWSERRHLLKVRSQTRFNENERNSKFGEDHFAFQYTTARLGNVVQKGSSFYPRVVLPAGFARVELHKYQSMDFHFNYRDRSYKMEYSFKNVPERIRVRMESQLVNSTVINLLIPIGIIPKVYVQEPQVDEKEWSLFRHWRRVPSNVVDDPLLSNQKRYVDENHIRDFINPLGRCSEHMYFIKLNSYKSQANSESHFRKLMKNMEDFGLVNLDGWVNRSVDQELKSYQDYTKQKNDSIGKLKELPFQSLKPYDLSQADIPYSVTFQLLAMINQFTISEFDIDQEFIDKLKKLDETHASFILEAMRGKNKRLKDIHAALDKWLNNVQSDENLKVNMFRAIRMGINHRRIRKVIVTPTKVYLSGPQLEMTNRIIRTYKNKTDQFIRVAFTDEDFLPLGHNEFIFGMLYDRILAFLNMSIDIHGRQFEFLHYSSSQLRTNGCWFFQPDNECTPNSIRRGMGVFHDIHNPAKYGARMAQCFSSTTVTGTIKANNVIMIEDVTRNGHVFSDGVGRVGTAIACKMIKELKKYLKIPTNFPSAYQFRMAGCKGVLTVDRKIPRNQIQIRPSQKKFESNHYAIEVCRCSFYSPGFLNRQVITLLETMGIHKDSFMEMTQEMIQRLQMVFSSPDNAKIILREYEDEYGVSEMLVSMISAGFFYMKDPFLINLLRLFYFIQLKELKLKTKLHVAKSCSLLGVLDETGTLPANHVFVQYTNPNTLKIENLKGHVLVNRSPCLHPGDIQKVTAASVADYPQLKHMVDVVVFSQFGDVPLPQMIAGGDLDGDAYLVIWDERLLGIQESKPMDYSDPIELKLERRVRMDDVKEHFINYLKKNNLGTIANTWIAICDASPMGALDAKALQLAELHSQAVDFPKKGIPAIMPPDIFVRSFPDFMEKKHKNTYLSEKSIGEIYRSVRLDIIEGLIPSLDKPHEALMIPGFDFFMEEGYSIGKAYAKDLYSLMRQYSIETEYELISGYLIKVVDPSLKRKTYDMKDQLMTTVSKLKKHYRSLFFNKDFPDGVEGSKLNHEGKEDYMESGFSELPLPYYQRASAWYQTTFKYTNPEIIHSRYEKLDYKDHTEVNAEEMARRLRGLNIHDSLDEHYNNDGFQQVTVPEIPVSFGWIMYDVLCFIVSKRNVHGEVIVK